MRVNESEDLYDVENGVSVASARDMIIRDCPDGVEICELGQGVRPFRVDQTELKNAKSAVAGRPEMRLLAYYVPGFAGAEWSDAEGSIECRADYDRYVDRNSEFWTGDAETAELAIPAFVKAFPTYGDWQSARGRNAAEELFSCFRRSGRMPYEYVTRNRIRTASDGTAYVIMAWRA